MTGTEDGPEGGRSLLDQALDVLVYAPVGLALTAAEDLPKLVDKGRERVSTQVGLARMVGQLAVGEVQRRAGRLFGWPGPSGPDGPTPPRASAPRARAPQASSAPGPGPRPGSTPSRGRSRGPVSAPAGRASELAIPGYDALSASQVVQRLAGLSPVELDAVRSYEAAHRARRTILNRVAQLQPGSG